MPRRPEKGGRCETTVCGDGAEEARLVLWFPRCSYAAQAVVLGSQAPLLCSAWGGVFPTRTVWGDGEEVRREQLGPCARQLLCFTELSFFFFFFFLHQLAAWFCGPGP